MVAQLSFIGEVLQGYIASARYYTCLGVLVVRLGNLDLRRGYEAEVWGACQ